MEPIKKALNVTLGSTPSFGSKSAYRTNYPDRNPVFNATIMAQHSSGELVKVWWGDLELTDQDTLMKLKVCAEEFKSNLYVYRESTVNNAVINGHMFPYTEYELRIDRYLKR